ncbi:MAG: DUF362 domain-containing protein [Phycisphaerae bacterium]|jgi:uncharacterized protein (DUF362 family)
MDMPTRAVVAVERADSYAPPVLRAAIERAVARLGGWRALVRPGDRVLVKPNCIAASSPEQAAQTHPAVILEVCRQLIDFGARPFVGDSPAWGSLAGNLRAMGALDELERLGVPLVDFKRAVKADNPRGKVFHRLTVDAAALEADAIVNLPKFKAHRQLVLTAAIKNMFGCVTGRRKAWWHVKAGGYDNYFGRMLVETFELLRPAVTLIDAVTAMEGNGPMRGSPRAMNLILASTDGPALERVSAELVGIKPTALRTLLAARELEIGTPYLDRVDVAGLPLAEARVADFVMPKMMPIGFSLPRVVKGAFKNAWLVHQQNKAAEAASR